MFHRESSRVPLIALVSGVAAAIPPAVRAVSATMPDAQLWNILDDRLIADATEAGGVSPELSERMLRLIEHASLEGADAVLLTCSLYSFLAADASIRFGIPVQGPDDAAFREVANRGSRTLHLVSSVEAALQDSAHRAAGAFATAGVQIDIVPVLAEGARSPSLAGDTDAVVDAIVSASATSGTAADAVLLANYSLADAAPGVGTRLGVPVITGPASAAEALRDALSSVPRSPSAVV
jgi:Asp/Glu/hydantoin racemase